MPQSLSLSLLLTVFYAAQSDDLSGHSRSEKTYATVAESYYFPKIKTGIAKPTQDCLHWQTSKSMPNLLMAQQQPVLEVSPYFNQRISMDTRGPISATSDGNSSIYVIIDAFTDLVVLHTSPQK